MKKRFSLVLVKPSHYDDEGYVIQWLRSAMPSNSLAVLYGLAKECSEQKILGPDVEINIHAYDETNSRIHIEQIASLIEDADAGMVMLVGVQSNQFPRALDIAAPIFWPARTEIAIDSPKAGMITTCTMLEPTPYAAMVRVPKEVMRKISTIRPRARADCSTEAGAPR